MAKIIRLAMGSIVVGVAVLALKSLAYWMTGSIALYSDALESTVNVATAVAAFLAVRYSARPADAGHPYGHNKAEYFSAVLEGVMIVVAAIMIMREAWLGFLAPKVLVAPLEGLLVNALASVINGVWCWVLLTEGKRQRSPALLADGTAPADRRNVVHRRNARRAARHRHGMGLPRCSPGGGGGVEHPLVRLAGDEAVHWRAAG